jgi:thioredoxin 1
MAIAVNEANFETVVLQATRPVLVDFWAEWCGPCKMMLPIVEELSRAFEGRVEVVKVDVDNAPTISSRYGIRNIPTILFFKNGEVVDKQVGAVPRSALETKINAML